MAQERQFGQRFLRAARAVVCIEAAGSVRCVCGARARTLGRRVQIVDSTAAKRVFEGV